jgi:hypothetical protein
MLLIVSSVNVRSGPHTFSFPNQRAQIHLLGLAQLALVLVEVAQVVDHGGHQCVLQSKSLLTALQRPHVHLLGLAQLALVRVEHARIIPFLPVQGFNLLKSIKVLVGKDEMKGHSGTGVKRTLITAIS